MALYKYQATTMVTAKVTTLITIFQGRLMPGCRQINGKASGPKLHSASTITEV